METRGPLSSYADVIRFWADRAPKLRTSNRGFATGKTGMGTMTTTPPSWAEASSMVEALMTMAQSEKTRLVQLYEKSRSRFAPLSDPLDGAFRFHRQLSAEREEVYSDWLAWVLESIANVSMMGQILGSQSLQQLAVSGDRVEVRREVCVEHGHADQAGRLDIVVRQEGKLLTIIEVKTQRYGAADLTKHEGYRRSASADTELIFLAVNPPDSDPAYFSVSFVVGAMHQSSSPLRSAARPGSCPGHVARAGLRRSRREPARVCTPGNPLFE